MAYREVTRGAQGVLRSGSDYRSCKCCCTAPGKLTHIREGEVQPAALPESWELYHKAEHQQHVTGSPLQHPRAWKSAVHA